MLHLPSLPFPPHLSQLLQDALAVLLALPHILVAAGCQALLCSRRAHKKVEVKLSAGGQRAGQGCSSPINGTLSGKFQSKAHSVTLRQHLLEPSGMPPRGCR